MEKMKDLLLNIVLLVSLQKSASFGNGHFKGNSIPFEQQHYTVHASDMKINTFNLLAEPEEPSDINPLPYQRTTRVLICVNTSTPKQFSIKHFKKLLRIFPTTDIEYHNVSECSKQVENNDQTILAVIAPRPFEGISETNIPMYFYDVPYNVSKFYDNVFPNSVSQVKDGGRPLKYAFSHYFRSQGWERIAIISDDSLYSGVFESELVEHLREEGFVYNVQRCYSTALQICDFSDALSFIIRHKALVVVANVDAANAASLEGLMRHSDWKWNQYVWMTRDWDVAQALAKMAPLVVSFGLAPKTDNVRPELRDMVPQSPHFSSIGQGLSLIVDAAQDKKERIELFYKNIAAHMNKNLNTYKTQAYIQQVIRGSVDLIQVLHVSDRSVEVDYLSDKSLYKIYDLPDCSLKRSGQFLSPCYDITIILFVFVWCSFIIMMFILVYFFNRYLVWT